MGTLIVVVVNYPDAELTIGCFTSLAEAARSAYSGNQVAIADSDSDQSG